MSQDETIVTEAALEAAADSAQRTCRPRRFADRQNSQYELLLAESGSGTATTLAARFDIDLHDPEFWRAGLAVIEEQVEQYLSL